MIKTLPIAGWAVLFVSAIAASGEEPNGDAREVAAMVKRLGGTVYRAGERQDGPIIGVGLPNCKQISTETLAALRALPELEGLDLSASKIRDEHLRALRGASKLKGLDLSRTAITDEGLAFVAGLSRLTTLEANQTKITNQSLKTIGGLSELTKLRLNDTKIDDAGIAELRRLTKLEYLALQNTGLTDAGLRQLENLNRLRYLFIRGTRVTDAGVPSLAKLPSFALPGLVKMDVRGTQITSRGVGQLMALGEDVARVVVLEIDESQYAEDMREKWANARLLVFEADGSYFLNRPPPKPATVNEAGDARADPELVRQIETCLAALGSDQFREREAAQARLTSAGKHAIPFLLRAIDESPDVEVKSRAWAVLSDLAGAYDPDTSPTLVAALEELAKSSNSRLRRAAAEALSRHRARREKVKSGDPF